MNIYQDVYTSLKLYSVSLIKISQKAKTFSYLKLLFLKASISKM